jgi:hypothetical protein
MIFIHVELKEVHQCQEYLFKFFVLYLIVKLINSSYSMVNKNSPDFRSLFIVGFKNSTSIQKIIKYAHFNHICKNRSHKMYFIEIWWMLNLIKVGKLLLLENFYSSNLTLKNYIFILCVRIYCIKKPESMKKYNI